MKNIVMLVCCALSVVALSGCGPWWSHGPNGGQNGGDIPHAAPGSGGTPSGIEGGPAGQ